jgi:hypothetical protein
MSVLVDLDLVSHIMYLREGCINPGDEEQVDRYEKKIAEWHRDVVEKNPKFDSTKIPTKEEMSSVFYKVVNNFEGYWCEGEECKCDCSHWVIHESLSTCWECTHDPCACRAPLV